MKTLSPPLTGEIDAGVIKKFREQLHAVGGVWILMGCVIAAAGVYFSSSTQSAGVSWASLPLSVALFVGLGGTLVTLGVFACLKKRWAITAGLIVSYLVLAGNVLSWLEQVSAPVNNASPSTLSIVIWGAIIVQCHRVVSWANRMRKADVPLTARPEDY
jgi:hypothetical protein